jgi:hypothetical protein
MKTPIKPSQLPVAVLAASMRFYSAALHALLRSGALTAKPPQGWVRSLCSCGVVIKMNLFRQIHGRFLRNPRVEQPVSNVGS